MSRKGRPDYNIDSGNLKDSLLRQGRKSSVEHFNPIRFPAPEGQL